MDTDFVHFAKNKELYSKDKELFDTLLYIWKNNGYLPGGGERVSLKDTFDRDVRHTTLMRDGYSRDHPLLTQRVISDIAKEAVEPTAILEPYFETINLPGGIHIIPSWGGMHAADVDEGESFPERELELAGYIQAAIGKSGVAVALSDEMIRFSAYDVMGVYLRAAAAALKRHKEVKLAAAIVDNGTVVFNNDSTSVSSTTGRNASGAYNGTVALDDFVKVHDTLLSEGYQPNTLIVHPRAWIIFSEPSLARMFGIQRGISWSADDQGANESRQAHNVPSGFPTDWNILVTPYMPLTSSTASVYPLTDIVMCDSNSLGVILDHGEGVQTMDFVDPSRDIRKVNLREKYGISILEDGKAIGVMKNVSVARGTDFAAGVTATLTEANLNLSGDIDYTAVITGTR
jgi:hypothetical protein